MAEETVSEAAARGWARVAEHVEAAIRAIPRPSIPESVRNPKEMAKRLKVLCKQVKAQLKEMMTHVHVMSFHVYSLLQELASKLADLVARFVSYISHKVKSFLSWVSALVHSVKARFVHLD